MRSRGTPWRSISVAAVCRSAWAPLAGEAIASALHGATHHTRNAMSTHKWPERGNASNECVITALRSGAASEVINDCVPNLLRQRQPNLITSLPRDAQRTGLPFDVTKPETRDGPGPKPQPVPQKKHSPIATPRRRRAIARGDQRLDLVRSQMLR